MDAKEFLKPNIVKIIITVILNAILWFLPIIPVETPIECPGCGSATFFYSVYKWLFEFAIRNEIAVILSLVIIVFATYLISCFITSKYKKNL